MQELLKKFENKKPEIIFEWSDSESEAEGWVVINSLRGGAAGGGTRMRKGLDKREVESLAKTMEVKFTVSGPAIGGAKSGINFDPKDPRKDEVLRRWYKAVTPLLKNYYGTGGDLNVDEIHEVIPITESFGIWHPQEGVVNGHFHATEPEKIRKIGQLRQGVSKVLEDPHFTPNGPKKYTVADMITGYGVAEAVRHYYKIWGGNLKGKRAVIQGWGNVGAAAACFLAVEGVKIVGIIDRDGGLIKKEGFSLDEVRELFITRNGNQLIADQLIPFDMINEEIWDLESEIFIPAAASRLITKEQSERMIKAGLEVISCGANVPFADPEIFFGPIGAWTDHQVSVIPDFIANCGMARVFAYLMSDQAEVTDQAIFKDVSKTIEKALKKTFAENPGKTKLAESSFKIALGQLV
ncbi:MAG TPA: amino acid dehydrogenase [Algoriphagus sp.]|jgi:glutamate dehydrogenase/leucine dehydrogenase|uniref:Glu/Leu/Phe/Val dehydrogenase dimerization domain-containing protein n=1 Tax=unclassified Algoriphagus TaxID=2641541 RepID=UPI000C5D22AD|nr:MULTISPECIES: Glu/Leu/Phe/Val dehydrogenase dimerization domain-containing protein [unclassified Algoriphagus]MAL15434.1 amino acid dehydrogenase [Algoriphagus sp.]MAN86825.1 amino acid dehydrogenase [Algoriphagus sp.]QYH40380.1 amino acid dehydrogenase [Algoriphagus sp. NBT04N3]HAD50234.1 amino acid dehydrogenase [Algoriphagus sp.]HAH35501.1 amino acid dehydrogenase [Algoriphagus sp.]|tara:strand:- start:13118 stop:14344 length:1227 start_codon:yes stop_codon:yes gene_type:complete